MITKIIYIMKHIKKYNEDYEEGNTRHEVSECSLGQTHTISDTNATFVIDGEEYGFTIRETGDVSGANYECEFLPDHDLPFELTKEITDQMYRMYDDESTK